MRRVQMMTEVEHLQDESLVGGVIELEEMGQLCRGQIGSISQDEGNCYIVVEQMRRVSLGPQQDEVLRKSVLFSFNVAHSSIRLDEGGRLRVVTPYVGTFRLYPVSVSDICPQLLH